jgi:hypothetical protein
MFFGLLSLRDGDARAAEWAFVRAEMQSRKIARWLDPTPGPDGGRFGYVEDRTWDWIESRLAAEMGTHLQSARLETWRTQWAAWLPVGVAALFFVYWAALLYALIGRCIQRDVPPRAAVAIGLSIIATAAFWFVA